MKKLDECERQRDLLDTIIQGLQEEVLGLQNALIRLEGVDAIREFVDVLELGEPDADAASEGPARLPQPPPLWQRITRTDAVMRLIAENGPIGPRDLAELLRAHGRTDNAHQVYSVIARLRSQERIRSEGRGLWVAVAVERPKVARLRREAEP